MGPWRGHCLLPTLSEKLSCRGGHGNQPHPGGKSELTSHSPPVSPQSWRGGPGSSCPAPMTELSVGWEEGSVGRRKGERRRERRREGREGERSGEGRGVGREGERSGGGVGWELWAGPAPWEQPLSQGGEGSAQCEARATAPPCPPHRGTSPCGPYLDPPHRVFNGRRRGRHFLVHHGPKLLLAHIQALRLQLLGEVIQGSNEVTSTPDNPTGSPGQQGFGVLCPHPMSHSYPPTVPGPLSATVACLTWPS